MINNKDIKKIAKMLTDDPDIFNEMAVTGADIATSLAPGGGIKTPRKKKKRRKKVMNDEPITKEHPKKINGNENGDGEEFDTLVDPDTERSPVGPDGHPIGNKKILNEK